jgi:hypothetical protein
VHLSRSRASGRRAFSPGTHLRYHLRCHLRLRATTRLPERDGATARTDDAEKTNRAAPEQMADRFRHWLVRRTGASCGRAGLFNSLAMTNGHTENPGRPRGMVRSPGGGNVWDGRGERTTGSGRPQDSNFRASTRRDGAPNSFPHRTTDPRRAAPRSPRPLP